MARVKLELPKKTHFTTKIQLRISDINYGGHLGNDAVLSLAHEARMQFLAHHGWTELNLLSCGLIQADTAIVYRSEGFYGNEIEIAITVYDITAMGFDLFYQMKNLTTGKELARVKTGMVTYDYKAAKVVRVPEAFTSIFAD